MRLKDSVVALKDLPQPELRIFGPTSGVTSIYGNGAVVVEASTGHGYFPSHRELVERLGPDYQTLISKVEQSYQIEKNVREEVGRSLDELAGSEPPALHDIRDLRARRSPLNTAPLPEVVAPNPFYTVEHPLTTGRARRTLLTAAVATF
jgi:hypothetical protein